MAFTGVIPSLRSASKAKSIIIMPFFFTIPMSRQTNQSNYAEISPHDHE